MARMKFKRNLNVNRIVVKVVATVLGLYVGGTILTEVGVAMNATCSPFYKGLSLIGWSVGTNHCSTTSASDANTLNAIGQNAGILAVVGIVAIASIVTEFVEFSM